LRVNQDNLTGYLVVIRLMIGFVCFDMRGLYLVFRIERNGTHRL